MTLKEFIEDLTKEMNENKWQNKEVEFVTIDKDKLVYLSIYDYGKKKVIIDIGTDEDVEERNGQLE